MKIPKFKNTNEAMAYGLSASPEQIKILRQRRKGLSTQVDKLLNKGKEEKAWPIVVQTQLIREAIEEYQKKHK